MRAGAPACTAGPAAPWRPHGRWCCAVAAGLRGMPPVASCCTSTSASNLGGRACEACLKYRDGPRRPFPPLRVHRYEILLLTSIDARLATNSPGDRLHSETRSGPVPKRLDSRAGKPAGRGAPPGAFLSWECRDQRADAGGSDERMRGAGHGLWLEGGDRGSGRGARASGKGNARTGKAAQDDGASQKALHPKRIGRVKAAPTQRGPARKTGLQVVRA